MWLVKVVFVSVLIFLTSRACCLFLSIPNPRSHSTFITTRMQPQGYATGASRLLAFCSLLHLHSICNLPLHFGNVWSQMPSRNRVFKLASFGEPCAAAYPGNRMEQYHVEHAYCSSNSETVKYLSRLSNKPEMSVAWSQENGGKSLPSYPLGRGLDSIPNDEDSFQKALKNLNQEFLTLAVNRNGELLRALMILWQQRRKSQLKEKQLASVQGAATYTRSGTGHTFPQDGEHSAFRAKAYRKAYDILQRVWIPIYNIAEVLLLLREGGLVLRGEENHFVRRGSFRSAVLQNLYLVIHQGTKEMIKSSRKASREEVVGELSRLPGVSRRLAALLFDEHFIEGQDDLRRRLGSPTDPTAIRAFPLGMPPSDLTAYKSMSERLPLPGYSANFCRSGLTRRLYTCDPDIKKYFPTAESRACIVHSEAFSAPFSTTEFDEWQEQLLGVQSALRNMAEGRILEKQMRNQMGFAEGAHVATASPVPVVSLGGGIFYKCGKVTPLKVLVSLLPSWVESGSVPPAVEKGLRSFGEGVGDREISWIQSQWDNLGKTYQAIKKQLKQNVISELIRQHLVEEVISNSTRTRISYAAGRLPWRPETYRLVNQRHYCV